MSTDHEFASKTRSAGESVACVRPGQRVFIGSGAAEPQTLVEALSARADLCDTEIIHILTLGVATYAEPRFGSRFRHNAYFIGPNVRQAVNEGRADYTPVFLSEVPALFRTGRVAIDVALISVSPPDEHGFCSFGVSTDIVKSASECAKIVVAEVNRQMPRALGDCFIHVDDIDLVVPSERPIPELTNGAPDEIAAKIGWQIAQLVEDGATLQLGIGTIPDSVLPHLMGFKNLGVHTEMFSDGLIRLIEGGVVTNSAKAIHRGKIIATFVLGTRRLYDFIDNNPLVEFHPSDYVNDPYVIGQNDKMISINAAIEVDLTGQVCADSLGTMFYSGIGGQVDFVRGAARSKGGKPIIALPSTASNGTVSRIVPVLKPGAGVVTSRGDVHYIVSEYGTAYLHGKTIRERALALIEIAHPRFRPWLVAEAKERKLIYFDQIELPLSVALYPTEQERWLALADNARVFVRPLKITDEALIRELFYSLSAQSVQQRFFSMLASMPHDKRQELMRIDYANDMALLVLDNSGAGAKALAIAQYRRTPNSSFAEVAFLVRDDWQHRGISTQLLKDLADYARAHGVAGFTAEVLADNSAMLSVFQQSGFRIESDMQDGVCSLQFPLDREPIPANTSKERAGAGGIF
ncbi:MAG: GNAT family N-acetyltransferase [Planctomycetes bacterium]|nr:GNAT family N-acetyltransferase [Planctomycetota bacterium]MBI3833931.1 GNAT family N-acetyltransferase [Planctomycetota bacterium]